MFQILFWIQITQLLKKSPTYENESQPLRYIMNLLIKRSFDSICFLYGNFLL